MRLSRLTIIIGVLAGTSILLACPAGLTGPEEYRITGRVVDENGAGIASVMPSSSGSSRPRDSISLRWTSSSVCRNGSSRSTRSCPQTVVEANGWRSEGEVFNQEGLVGEWTVDGTLTSPYGTMLSSGSFTMPPRPEFGPWEALPYEVITRGTFVLDDATVDVTAVYDLVSEIQCLDEAPYLTAASCTVTTTTTITTPDFTQTFVDESPCEAIPAQIENAQ